MPGIPPKIADGLANADEILGDRYAKTTTNDKKIWFVSQKAVNQPSINWGHTTPLQGGHVVNFDLRTKSWSKPVSFPSLSDEELLDGEIFGYKNHLLLMTYEKCKQFKFRDLYEWRDDAWKKIDHFEFDADTSFECGDRADLHRVADESGEIYFLAEQGRGLNVYRFHFDSGKAKITVQKSIMNMYQERCPGAHLVRMAVSGHHLYALYGEQGCGFRWAPTRPIRIDLNDGKVEQLKVGEEIVEAGSTQCPPWSFSGAYADSLIPPSRWFFFGGCRAKGLSSTEDDRSIWEMDLEKKEWKRCDAYDLPNGAGFAGAFGGVFYLVNVNGGVYELDPKKV